MKYQVRLTEEAERDLLDIWDYVALNDTPEDADDLLDHLEQRSSTLSTLPGRGHVPPELKRLGIEMVREIHTKPYRILYGISGRNVYIHGYLDGRRDLQDILERRLLR
jgi:toxin ParE1/3/4